MAVFRSKNGILTVWRNTYFANIWVNFIWFMLKLYQKLSHINIPYFDSVVSSSGYNVLLIWSDPGWKYISIMSFFQFKNTIFCIVAPIFNYILMTCYHITFCVWYMHIIAFWFQLNVSYIFLSIYVPKSYLTI